MVESAAKRALRAMDLIPFVLENPGVTFAELSAKFSVDRDQIEKDLQLIFMCGLPGYTPYELIDIFIDADAVSVIDPQVLDRPRSFTSTELIVLTLGLIVLQQLNQSHAENFERIEKLRKKIALTGDEHIMFRRSNLQLSPHYKMITDAINMDLLIHFDYRSLVKDEITQRRVVPKDLSIVTGKVYLSGFDLNSMSLRTFRVDLISKCMHGESSRSVLQVIEPDQATTRVVLQIKKSAQIFIERNSVLITEIHANNSGFEVILSISNLEWLKRAVLSYAPEIAVIEPISLAQELRQMAERLILLYQGERKS